MKNQLTHFSLFSGIGGFDLAAEWAGFRTVGLVEKNPYRQKVLRKYWPDVPMWEDIRDVTEKSVKEANLGAVTLVTGGFPCQGFSVAGKRRGKADDRYLWPEMLGVIRLLQPNWVLAENVAGIIRMALNTVLSDLESEGYRAVTFVIPACGANAPHRRNRVWIVAHSGNKRRGGRSDGDEERFLGPLQAEGSGSASEQGILADTEDGRLRPQFNKIAGELLSGNGTPQEPEGGSRSVPDSNNQGLPDEKRGEDHARASRFGTLSLPGWWESEPDVGRALDGFSSWLDGFDMTPSHKLLWVYGNATKTRPREVLRVLRSSFAPENDWGEAGGLLGVSATQILFAYLCKLKETPPALDNLPPEGKEVQGNNLRSLWNSNQPSSPPHRSRHPKQRQREYPNPLQTLSRFLAQHAEKAWSQYRWENAQNVFLNWIEGWENGFARVADGVPHRVDRLAALGDAIVPQVAYQILRAIAETERAIWTR